MDETPKAIRTREEIMDKLDEIKKSKGRCCFIANCHEAGGWLDALVWVLGSDTRYYDSIFFGE